MAYLESRAIAFEILAAISRANCCCSSPILRDKTSSSTDVERIEAENHQKSQMKASKFSNAIALTWKATRLDARATAAYNTFVRLSHGEAVLCRRLVGSRAEGVMPITRDGVELTVEISEKAAQKIRYFAEKEGLDDDDVGIRVAVKGGGCSGLTYDLKITGQHADTDKVVEQYGVKVIVDKKSYIYLAGTQLDFSDGLNGKGFIFENPNAKKACGCGTSFSV